MTERAVQKSDSLEYKAAYSVRPTYQFLNLYKQDGGTTATMAQGTELIFEIPSKVLNLSKSELLFTATPDAVEDKKNVFWADLVPWFSQVQLYTRGGLFLADIRYAEFVNLVTKKATTSTEEMLNNDFSSGGLNRVNNIGTTQRSNGTDCNIPYTEIKYGEYSGVGNVNTATPQIIYKIPLKNIGTDSILEMDKDLYFGEVILLRFVLNGPGSVGISVDATADLSGGAVAMAGVELSNISLRLACEKYQDIEKKVMDKVNSGMTLSIPYIHAFKNSLTGGNGAACTVALRLNRAHGHSLMRVYHYGLITRANNVDTVANEKYNMSNIAAEKFQSYYSMVDNQRVQQFDLEAKKFDDYEFHRELLKDSAVGQNKNSYQYNFFHCDDFTGFKSPEERQKIFEDNILCGLRLENERKWDIYMTTASDNFAILYDFYTVAVCQRSLHISKNGMSIM